MVRLILFMLALCSWVAVIGDGSATAARFPNAVERSFTLGGESASTLARFLGLSASSMSSVRLPFNKHDAWAVYLLKKDTPQELLNSNDKMPSRENLLQFSQSPEPVIAISPYWLDLATQLPAREEGVFSFSSPPVEKSDPQSAWAVLLRALSQEPEWKEGRQLSYERTFSSTSATKLRLRVWANDSSSFVVQIAIREH